MDARAIVEAYFAALGRGQGWQDYFADNMAFASFTAPPRRLAGKKAFLDGTQRFYGNIHTVDIREMLVDGARVCALTHYTLKSPGEAPPFESDVAELFSVREGKVIGLEIYFDSAPYRGPD